MTYEECIKALKEGTYSITEDGLTIRVKPIPETDRKGVADPRALASAKQGKPFPMPKDDRNPSLEEIQAIRRWMGCKNQDLSHGVTTEDRVIPTRHGEVPVKVYSPKEAVKGKSQVPVVVYIHGGAFYGGTVRVVENSCRLLADLAGAVVISVDYGLAPEHKFPEGLMQCYGVVKWVSEHGEELGADGRKLAVMGDSAGGNLAAACCLLDKEGRIKLQVLLYPTLVQTQQYYDNWTEDGFEMAEDTEILRDMILGTRIGAYVLKAAYLNNEEESENPLVSPLLSAELSRMPMTMIVTAEFDALRPEAEEYARKLLEEGVDTVVYRYQGMGHAFFEHPGEFPQSEDCIREASEAIKTL